MDSKDNGIQIDFASIVLVAVIGGLLFVSYDGIALINKGN
jgi:hypothetical protein